MRHTVFCLLLAVLAASLNAMDLPLNPKRAKEEWREAITAALAKKTTVDFDKKPLADCIAALKETMGVNFIVDPPAIAKDAPVVTLKQKDMLISDALKQVLAKGGLDYQVRDGVVFVMNPKNLDNDMLKSEDLHVARMLDGRQEHLDFQPAKEPAGDLLKQLCEPTGIAMKMTEDLKKVPITLDLKNVSVGHAIRWLVRYSGGMIDVKTDGMTVIKRTK